MTSISKSIDIKACYCPHQGTIIMKMFNINSIIRGYYVSRDVMTLQKHKENNNNNNWTIMNNFF
jgi:hypothetical protein